MTTAMSPRGVGADNRVTMSEKHFSAGPTCRCREPCHALSPALSQLAELGITIEYRRLMIARCGCTNRVADARSRDVRGLWGSRTWPWCLTSGFRLPVGAENRVTSGDLHVLVDEAAEPVTSQHADGRPRTWRDAARGRALIQRSV